MYSSWQVVLGMKLLLFDAFQKKMGDPRLGLRSKLEWWLGVESTRGFMAAVE